MKDYAKTHQHKTNIKIHFIAVPLFWGATYLLLYGIVYINLLVLIASIPMYGFSLYLQKIGHEKEHQAVKPFTGIGQFIYRLFKEQFVLFPIYFLTGRAFKTFKL